MNKEQSAAYVISQSVCAMAEIESMKAENCMREMQGNTIAYGEEAFMEVINKYGIHPNAVITIMNNAQDN